MKFIHCADFHFGRPLSSIDSETAADIIREEMFEALKEICGLAADADALLIAGDLFDSPRIDERTAEKVFGCLSEVGRVFISPGNHDMPDVYRKLRLPQNVHVFLGETECVDCENFAVWGNGGRPIGDVALDSEKVNILCIHTQLDGSGEYNSISSRELCSHGFSYAALGHVHSFSGVKESGGTHYAYSGCPVGGGFDELGDTGVISLEITKSSFDAQFVPCGKRRFREETVILSNAGGYDDIVLSEPQKSDLYKITLKGTVSEDFILRPDILREKINDRYFFVKVNNETRVHIPYDDMAKEYSLKGIFVSKMLEKIKSDPENPELLRALELGVRVLDGKKAGDCL